jgi:phenylalanyl-tRNA synthetase beta subunit
MREFAPAGADVNDVATRLANVGFEVAEIVSSPEPEIDFEITANRPDCLSVIGLAREASVAFAVPFKANPASAGNPANPVNPVNPSSAPWHASRTSRSASTRPTSARGTSPRSRA